MTKPEKFLISGFFILFAIVGAGVLAFTYFWNKSDFKEYEYQTKYGDTFTVSVDVYLGKANIYCSDYQFETRLQYYKEGDPLTVLCDTDDYTCYEISGVTICKIEQNDTMFAVYRTFRNGAEVCDYLQSTLTETESAPKSISS